MIFKTRGIVLKHTKYRETSVIVTILTEEFGTKAYIVNGVRSAKSKRGMGHFQILTMLDLVVYDAPNKELNRISEWKIAVPLFSIYQDRRKAAIALFIAELLTKSAKGDSASRDLFEFTFSSIEVLENLQKGIGLFHIQFMIRLARFLGFGTDYYTSAIEAGIEEEIRYLDNVAYGEAKGISNERRTHLIEYLMGYYSDHIPGFGVMRSYEVLKEIFSV